MSESFKNPFESLETHTPKIEPETGIAIAFIRDLKEILFHPKRFFGSIRGADDWRRAVTYAIIAHWAGALIQLALKTVGIVSIYDTFFAKLDELAQSKGVPLPGVLSQSLTNDALWVAIDPFFTLISAFSSAFLLFVSSLILIGDRSSNAVTFKRSFLIASFALVPSIFVGLPVLGSFIANLLVFLCLVRGLEEVYSISFTRAVFTVLLPKLVFFAVLLVIGVLFFASIFGLVMGTVGA